MKKHTTKSSVNYIQAGRTNPTIASLMTLADALALNKFLGI